MDSNDIKQDFELDLRYLLTGTRVYGPARQDSDLDIVMNYAGADNLVQFCKKHGIEIYKTEGQDGYGDEGGFYFDLGFIKVNVIIAGKDRPFEEWERLTEKMKKIEPIHDRERRILVFSENQGDSDADDLPF